MKIWKLTGLVCGMWVLPQKTQKAYDYCENGFLSDHRSSEWEGFRGLPLGSNSVRNEDCETYRLYGWNELCGLALKNSREPMIIERIVFQGP